MKTQKGGILHWEELFPGSRVWHLIQDGETLVTINYDIMRNEWYATQGKRGKPQYVFKGVSIDDAEIVMKKVYSIVKSKL